MVENLLLFCILSGLHASNETQISFLNQSSPLYVAANPETTLSSQGDVEPEKYIKNKFRTRLTKKLETIKIDLIDSMYLVFCYQNCSD